MMIKLLNNVKEITKPWGGERLIIKNKHYAMKILYIKASECLSFQYHTKKHETMLLWSGEAVLVYQTSKRKNVIRKDIYEGTIIDIPPGTKHRIIAETNCTIFECSTPGLNDVIRILDKYQRIKKVKI